MAATLNYNDQNHFPSTTIGMSAVDRSQESTSTRTNRANLLGASTKVRHLHPVVREEAGIDQLFVLTSAVKFAFPFKLHAMLHDVARDGNDAIVSWLPNGMQFRIHRPTEFAHFIMPRYFDKTKYRSFQRQLHIYGFQRVTDKKSPDFGAYHHELFQWGMSHLCFNMIRHKIKGPSGSLMSYSKKIEVSPDRLSKSQSEQHCPSSHISKPTCVNAISSAELLCNPSEGTPLPQKEYPSTSLTSATRSVPCLMGSESLDSDNCLRVLATKLNRKEDQTTLPFTQIKPFDKKDRAYPLGPTLFEIQELQDGDESFFAGKRFFFTDSAFNVLLS
jgi:hypothetical protein